MSDCQLCEHHVSKVKREREPEEGREIRADRCVLGVNATEQSLVMLPCYSGLFIILIQIFPCTEPQSLHCWAAGWWWDESMEEKGHRSGAVNVSPLESHSCSIEDEQRLGAA